ncbi:MAG: hypothetical protein IJA60_05715 [Clostridia bacterium]|nr:hypothetical protein [Clostridia bacterium]
MSKENGRYSSYGILVICEDKKQNAVKAHVSDAFAKYEDALHFANLCTEAQLDPIHLIDVLEDTL